MASEIRWLIKKRDMPRVADIDYQCYDLDSYTHNEISGILNKKNLTGVVYTYNQQTYGYMIYEIQKTYYTVVRVAADPAFADDDVYAAFYKYMVGKLDNNHRKKYVEIAVSDENLDQHLLLKQMGFKAIGMTKLYDEPDLYIFRHFQTSPISRP